MIASLRHQPVVWGASSLEEKVPSVLMAPSATRIWNELFLGVRAGHCARLRFTDGPRVEVLALQALDLRHEGWVIVGTCVGTASLKEHFIDHVSEVEMLGTMKSPKATEPLLPPAA